MTVTLDDRREIPIHPLDLTAASQSDPSSTTCVGLVQQDATLASPTFGLGDIILGVPFLRNVYTVMAYEAATSGGIVGNGSKSRSPSPSSFSPRRAVKRADIKPQLGLLNITDPATAMSEFNQVRVLKQPLDSANQNNNVESGGKKITVGLEVLFGLIGFVVLCAVLFFVRWFAVKRRLIRQGSVKGGLVGSGLKRASRGREREEKKDVDVYALTEYHGLGLEQTRSHSMVPSEDTQQTLKNLDDDHDHFGKKLDATYDSAKTKVNDGDWPSDTELGFRRKSKRVDSDDVDLRLHRMSSSSSSVRLNVENEEWSNTRDSQAWIDAYAMDQPALHGEWRPPSELSTHSHTHSHSLSASARPPVHERTLSSLSTFSTHSMQHGPGSPLLESSLDVIGLDFGDAAASVGGGARRRGSLGVVDEASAEEMRRVQQRRASSGSSVGSVQVPPARPRPGRVHSGPRMSTTMSQVISANDIQ